MIDASSLREEVARRRSTKSQSEFGAIPESIPYLQSFLTDQLSIDERHLIFAMILNECSRAKNDHLELHFLRRQLSALPLQPVLLASLAGGLAKFPERRAEALQAGAEAVRLAREEDRQVRYSLTALARLALSLKDYSTLERALSELVADAVVTREDAPYEFDFVDDLDARHISSDVISAYKRLQRS